MTRAGNCRLKEQGGPPQGIYPELLWGLDWAGIFGRSVFSLLTQEMSLTNVTRLKLSLPSPKEPGGAFYALSNRPRLLISLPSLSLAENPVWLRLSPECAGSANFSYRDREGKEIR